MKSNAKFLFFSACLVVVLGWNTALGQTQPASSFTFSNLISGIRFNVFGGTYSADDFFFSYVNPTAGTITVRAELNANNPNFQFLRCADVGTFQYPDVALGTIGDPLQSLVSTYSPNVLGVAVLASGQEFQGSLSVWTSGGESFYILPPADFTTASPRWANSACTAYHDAWQAGGPWNVPWFWDGTSQRLISPYSNYWHDNNYWVDGWNSNISIQNTGSQPVTYTVNYLSSTAPPGLADGYSYQTCSSYALNQTTTTQIIAPGNMWSGNLRDDIFQPSSNLDMVQQDGFLYITLNPVIAGTDPNETISALSSGTGYCGDGHCPLVFTCQ